MTQPKLSIEQIRNMVRDHDLGLKISEILDKYLDQPLVSDNQVRVGDEDVTLSILLDQNRELKHLVRDLVFEISARARHRNDVQVPHDENSSPVHAPSVPPADTESGFEERDLTAPFTIARSGQTARRGSSREPFGSLLNRSRIIPAIRGTEYIKSAIASPSLIVWLLYGTPLTLPEIARQVRSAGKLPIANLDLLTGFAHDSDGIELLAAEGVAGVVSTRQSALRAAHAQGMIAVQRTFVVDSIAVGNITRALQHFLPDAIELLPAAAAPLCVSHLRAAQPQLPVIATGLVTSMRQVEDLFQCGVSSVATSDVSLWVL